ISEYSVLPTIDFSKIAGFDVMPRSPSSLIICFRPPPVSRSRPMNAIQGDWPYSSRPFSGFTPAVFGFVTEVAIKLLLYLQGLLIVRLYPSGPSYSSRFQLFNILRLGACTFANGARASLPP